MAKIELLHPLYMNGESDNSILVMYNGFMYGHYYPNDRLSFESYLIENIKRLKWQLKNYGHGFPDTFSYTYNQAAILSAALKAYKNGLQPVKELSTIYNNSN